MSDLTVVLLVVLAMVSLWRARPGDRVWRDE
jgi:hypothetical protein